MEKLKFFLILSLFYFLEERPSDLKISPPMNRQTKGLPIRDIDNWMNQAAMFHVEDELGGQEFIAIDGNGYYLGRIEDKKLIFPTKEGEWTSAFLESTWETVMLEGDGTDRMKVWFSVDREIVATGDRLIISSPKDSENFYIAKIVMSKNDDAIWANLLGNTSSSDIELISQGKHLTNIK